MKVVFVASSNIGNQPLSANADSKYLMSADIVSAREKAVVEVLNCCKRYILCRSLYSHNSLCLLLPLLSTCLYMVLYCYVNVA